MAKQYEVHLHEEVTYVVYVTADCEEEAVEIAGERATHDDADEEFGYDIQLVSCDEIGEEN